MEQYTIKCNKEQLMLIANAVEDWSRFLSGQCEMWNATSLIDDTEDMHDCRKTLDRMVKPYVTPELGADASYGWSGGGCPNDNQRKAIAMSYGVYRQIRHVMAIGRKGDTYCVYNSPTLTCEEQGPLIQIEKTETDE